jgi:hypothetical protein
MRALILFCVWILSVFCIGPKVTECGLPNVGYLNEFLVQNNTDSFAA